MIYLIFLRNKQMILSDKTIKEYIKNNKIIVKSEYGIENVINNISCSSLDVRL